MPSSTFSSEVSRRAAQLGWFALAFVGLFAWASALQADIDSEHLTRRQRVLRRFGDRPAVFFGDSQIQCAVNDGLDPRILNLATGSEHYVFTLQKARLFRPRVAAIGTWVHAFLPYYESLIGRVYLNRYGIWRLAMTEAERRDILDRADFETASFGRTREYIPFLGTQFERRIATLRVGFGNFFELPGRAAFVEMEIPGWAQSLTVPGGAIRDSLQARDLARLVSHLGGRGIRVVLLSTPIRPELRAVIPPAAQAEFRQLLADLGRAPAVRYWDDSALQLTPGDFWDSNHLSGEAAAHYTEHLIARLEAEGLLEPLSSHAEDTEAGLGDGRVESR
jgi:hypothetical protein